MSLATDTDPGRAARDLPRKSLPVLDVGRARQGDGDAIEALARQWRETWEGTGFLCIVNHGVGQERIDAMTEMARRFHALPMDTKLRFRVTRDQKGYIPPRGGLTTHSAFHKAKKLDSVECIVVATDFPEDDPNRIAGKQFYGAMPWPDEDLVPGFRATTEDYMGRITALGKSLLPVWSRSLDLDAGFFTPKFENAYTYFRIAKYPKQPELEGDEMGVNAHVDTGFMTFLPPANEEGLQILDTDGSWFWPDLPDGAMIVNMGQFLERWTNGRFRATPHRVVPPVEADRYSLACFVNPSLDAVGQCLPTCTGPDNPPKYPTQTYWEFFHWYMTNTFTHYGKVKAGDNNEVAA